MRAQLRTETAILPRTDQGEAGDRARVGVRLQLEALAEQGVSGATGLVAAITLSEAAGAWLAARNWQIDGRRFVLLACGAAAVAVPLLLSAGAAVAAVALAFVLGLIHPLRAAALQRAAADGARARIASLASACDMACTTLGLLAAGAWSARRRSR